MTSPAGFLCHPVQFKTWAQPVWVPPHHPKIQGFRSQCHSHCPLLLDTQTIFFGGWGERYPFTQADLAVEVKHFGF